MGNNHNHNQNHNNDYNNDDNKTAYNREDAAGNRAPAQLQGPSGI